VFTALGAIARWLFVDDIRMTREESAGSRGLRATGYGAFAGLVGGLVFAVVMVLAGALPTVAGLVGSGSPGVGFVVHLVIGDVIGITYALLFRGRGPDAASGIGWGVSYGFLWWVLGNLTLLPVLTGGSPGWDAAALAAGFPSLVGHLAYGAALGGVLALLEARTNPWWSTRNEVEAQRAAMRQETALGSAPALWGFTTLIAAAIPLLIGG